MSPGRPEPGTRMAELGDYYAANAARLHTALARHFGGSDQLAEEALQAAFAKLVAREDIAAADAGGWLFTVARNEGYHLTELASRVDSLEYEIPMPDGGTLPVIDTIAGPQDTEATVEQRERLAGLAELKADQERTLRQYAEGHSYAEIAAINGCSHTKVDRSMKEGRAALRARETLMERQTEQHIADSHQLAPELPQSELQERRQRIAERRQRANIDLGMEIGR